MEQNIKTSHKGLIFKRKQYCLELDPKLFKLQVPKIIPEELSTCTPSPNSLENNYNQFAQMYLKKEKLGEGMHSVVYQVEEKSTGCNFAAKVTKTDDETLQYHVEQEFVILSQLQHKGIMRVEKQFNDKTKGTFVLISELVNLPQLHMYRGKVDLQWMRKMLFNLLDILKYLHGKNFIHRDISSRNVLVDENGLVKLIDFGLVEKITPGGVGVAGVKQIAPPELVGDQRMDIWNVGMLILELTEGKLIGSQNVKTVVTNSEWKRKWGNELAELVEGMLVEEDDRISAEKALEMQFFTLHKDKIAM